MLGLSAVFMAVTFVVFALYGILFAAAHAPPRDHAAARGAPGCDEAFAADVVVLAGRLAVEGR